MTSPKFRTAQGRLTRYSFACGYIEKNIVNEDNQVTMRLEPNGFHIKGFKLGFPVWDILEDVSIKDARKTLDNYFKQGLLVQKENRDFYTNVVRLNSVDWENRIADEQTVFNGLI